MVPWQMRKKKSRQCPFDAQFDSTLTLHETALAYAADVLPNADLEGDQKIGLKEALYVLQKIAED
jgi:hypothetical protein